MKIREGKDLYCDDGFWYGLTEGYVRPQELLVEQKDIDAVIAARDLLRDFEESLNEAYEDWQG